jgi:gluconolactonase
MSRQPTLSDIRVVCEGLDHPECVTVGPDGNLWAGGEAGQIYRIDGQTGQAQEIGRTGGFVLGVACDGNGYLYCCDVGLQAVVQVDCANGSVVRTIAHVHGRRLVNPNYAAFDDRGWLYVTDSGHWKQDDGWIIAFDPTGQVKWVSEQPRCFPNGIAWDRTSGRLWVVESTKPALSTLGCDGDGYRVELALPETVPDGMALAEDGEVFVGCYRPDAIYRVNKGVVAQWIADPEGTALSAPTNLCFGGDDRRTLYIASLGRWHIGSIVSDVAGQPLAYPSVRW